MEEKKEQVKLLDSFPVPDYEKWLSLVEKQLKGGSFEKRLVTKTVDGLDIKPLYLSPDIDSTNVGPPPGISPFTRGTGLTGLTQMDWGVSRRYVYPDATDNNEAILFDSERGLTTALLVLDRWGKAGMDSGDKGGIGQDGISVFDSKDMDTLLSGVNLSETGLLIDAGYSAFAFFCSLVNHCRSKGFDPALLNGSLIYDPLTSYAVQGNLPFSLDKLYDGMVGLVQLADQQDSEFRVLGIDVSPYTEAGGSVIQELSYGLALAVEYLRASLSRGLSINQVAKRMSLFLPTGSDFFTEIAKLRAARTLWAKIISSFGGDEDVQKLVIHSVSHKWNKTVYDPYVNLLRLTAEAYASVLGGCDTLSLDSFDGVLGLPNELSRRISRNIQIILRDECHADQVIDPAGGSWFVENLTGDIANAAWDSFQKIEEVGGFKMALEKNLIQDSVKDTARKQKEAVAKRKRVLVGSNMHPNLFESSPETFPFDDEAFASKRARQATASEREWDESVSDLKSGDAVDRVLETIESGATLAGINSLFIDSNAKRDSIQAIESSRLIDEYEILRQKAENHKKTQGEYPKAFLANMGPLKQHKARADFAREFLSPAGFDVIYSEGFNTVEEAAKAALESKTPIIVICSDDKSYPEIVPPLVGELKQNDKDLIVALAGYPVDHIETFNDAGVDEYIHLKAAHLQCLQNLQEKAGIR